MVTLVIPHHFHREPSRTVNVQAAIQTALFGLENYWRRWKEERLEFS